MKIHIFYILTTYHIKIFEKDAFTSVSKHQKSLMYKHNKRVEHKEQKNIRYSSKYFIIKIIIDSYCFQMIVQNTAVCL